MLMNIDYAVEQTDDDEAVAGVLIVDDSRFAVKILKDILIKENFTVLAEAKNGIEAIELAKKHKPAYIFLDVEMPVMDGLSALPKILEAYPSSYVVMCTAMGQQDIIDKAIKAGARDYVLKPYKRENIVGVMNVATMITSERKSLSKKAALQAKLKEEKLKKEEAERIAREKEEAERIAKEKEEAERIAKEKKEAERIAREKEEAERIAKEKEEAERIAKEKEEAERIAKEKEEAERIAKEKEEAERIAKEKEEAERIAKEKEEAERIAKEKEEAERIAKEKEEAERIAKEKEEAERIAKEKEEAERIAKEKEEAERIAKEKEEAERIAKEKEEAERIAKEKEEAERIAREKEEAERIAKEKEEAERIAKEKEEAERIAKEEEAERERLSLEPVNLDLFLLGDEEPEASRIIEDNYIMMEPPVDLSDFSQACIPSEESNTEISELEQKLLYGMKGSTELFGPGIRLLGEIGEEGSDRKVTKRTRPIEIIANQEEKLPTRIQDMRMKYQYLWDNRFSYWSGKKLNCMKTTKRVSSLVALKNDSNVQEKVDVDKNILSGLIQSYCMLSRFASEVRLRKLIEKSIISSERRIINRGLINKIKVGEITMSEMDCVVKNNQENEMTVFSTALMELINGDRLK